MQSIRVQGLVVGSRAHFLGMNRAITEHKMVPIVGQIFPFDDARKAFESIGRGRHYGKICILC